MLTLTLGSIVAIRVLVKIVRKTVLIPKLTILDDLPMVGQTRNDGKIRGRAVICGGRCVAGLLAAAVCSEHFQSVLVIEAEGSVTELGVDKTEGKDLQTTPALLRKRAEQHLTCHPFLPPVYLGLQRLFPHTLQQELAYFGFSVTPIAYRFTYGNNPSPDVFNPTDQNSPQSLPISRQSFETLLLRLVVKFCGNVKFITGTVDGYTRKDGGGRDISSVTVEGQNPETADFIVDATGPAQYSCHEWLRSAGFNPLPPSLAEYDPHLTYSQSVYTIPKEMLPEIEAVLPNGLLVGCVYINQPDNSTGESRALYIFLHENSQCKRS
ncbi:hypothetical protein FRB93_000037 [Tulasnella sp. JGI-2019a]|nr:hypothetical protein FRB93_000037 [Tulasnella sp. JGI-2019a]